MLKILFLVLVFFHFHAPVRAEVVYRKLTENTRATEWVFEKNKTLNDIMFNEEGEVITVLVVSGVFVTFIKSPNGLYRCSDLSIRDDKINETVCFKLAKPN